MGNPVCNDNIRGEGNEGVRFRVVNTVGESYEIEITRFADRGTQPQIIKNLASLPLLQALDFIQHGLFYGGIPRNIYPVSVCVELLINHLDMVFFNQIGGEFVMLEIVTCSERIKFTV